MLTIKRFQLNLLSENCYVVSDETNECMIVDCGAFDASEAEAIFQYIEENNLRPVLQVLTHAHFDHMFGVPAVYERYGLKPVVHANDEKLYYSFNEQCSNMLGHSFEAKLPDLSRCLNDGDMIKFGNHEFKTIHTPGHSRGSVFYYCESEKVAFSGDTLFRSSIGRTDLPGGSMFQIIQSLRMVMQLPDETRILSGHGDETTIGYELASNPYLDR